MANHSSDRLRSYYGFSKATIKQVSDFAKKQFEYKTYQDFFDDIGVGQVKVHHTKKGLGVPFVDIPAVSGKQKGVMVVHLPMGNPLDSNQLYQVATIAGVNADYRVIAFGNPSGGRFYYKAQRSKLSSIINIALNKNLKGLVEAELDYLKSQNIKSTWQVGYSFGALKALVHSNFSEPGSVKGLVMLDPVSHPRGVRQLVKDFKATFKPLGGYADSVGLNTFKQARRDAAQGPDFKLAQRRPISIAMGVLVSRWDLFKDLKKLFTSSPSTKVSLAWGSESELVDDRLMQRELGRLDDYDVKSIRLLGQKHAFANDIHLYAALVYEFLHQQ